jgi:hypothetical protein
MNEHVTDPAFSPVDKIAPVAGRGPRPDGTVEYQITEGDTYLDGKLVPKNPEVIGYIQIEPKEGHSRED